MQASGASFPNAEYPQHSLKRVCPLPPQRAGIVNEDVNATELVHLQLLGGKVHYRLIRSSGMFLLWGLM